MDHATTRETILKGRKFDFERVTFTNRLGERTTREVVRHPGAVCVLPVLDAGAAGREARVVMIRVYRFALDRDTWEFPAGTIEPGEPPEACAPRELIEETGYEARRIQRIGSFHTTPGMTDELMHAFFATDLREVGQRLEEDEQIKPVVVTVGEALAMIDDGRLADAKSMLTLLLAVRRGLVRGSA